MDNVIRISGLEPESIVDGPGLRYVIFTQGCPHHCPGCHNPATHDFTAGRDVTVRELMRDISENPLLSGVTFSGGEPMCQVKPLLALARLVTAAGMNVAIYTGYTFEQLIARRDNDVDELLSLTELLIDGPFLLAERDLAIRFRGSRNQRLIKCRESLAAGRVVLLEEVS